MNVHVLIKLVFLCIGKCGLHLRLLTACICSPYMRAALLGLQKDEREY